MKRLTSKHPLYKKVRQVEELMFELGIKIEHINGRFMVTDTDTDLRVEYLDAENLESADEFPSQFETKLIFRD